MELAPHAGPQRAVLRYQLGLVVPEPEACELRVAGTLARWREGEGMLWDDTFEHSAANRGTRPRVVLFLDVQRRDVPRRARALDAAAVALLRQTPAFADALRRAEAQPREEAAALRGGVAAVELRR